MYGNYGILVYGGSCIASDVAGSQSATLAVYAAARLRHVKAHK